MAKKILPRVFTLLWVVMILSLGVYYLLFASRDSVYSPDENRTLAGFPEITADSLFSGQFGQDFETYLLDHFPNRNAVISATNQLQSKLSLASHEEYLLIAEGPQDLLDTGVEQGDLDDLLSDFGTQPTEPVETEPVETEPVETEPVVTEPTEPKEDPPIQQKPAASLEDFPSTVGVYMDIGNGEQTISTYSRNNVAAVTAVLNKYARLLPENGKLMFTVVPQSSRANRFVTANTRNSFFSTWDEVVNGLGDNNVYAFDTAEILAPAMQAGEYVYFRTDMHWNPYGSYLVYAEMARQAGKEPCSYTDSFDLTVEAPFRGTYYRDNPGAYGGVEPDTLDLLMPKFSLEWRRVTGKDAYKLIDFLNFDARKNDRYTVYLGGPAGPWTYTESDNGQTENCLLITDSFGLGYLPFLTPNYKQVHYYDTRYYDKGVVGYTVAEMIELYNIQDIYVVVGDLHSFDSGFLLTSANQQLGIQ